MQSVSGRHTYLYVTVLQKEEYSVLQGYVENSDCKHALICTAICTVYIALNVNVSTLLLASVLMLQIKCTTLKPVKPIECLFGTMHVIPTKVSGKNKPVSNTNNTSMQVPEVRFQNP